MSWLLHKHSYLKLKRKLVRGYDAFLSLTSDKEDKFSLLSLQEKKHVCLAKINVDVKEDANLMIEPLVDVMTSQGYIFFDIIYPFLVFCGYTADVVMSYEIMKDMTNISSVQGWAEVYWGNFGNADHASFQMVLPKMAENLALLCTLEPGAHADLIV